RGNATQWPFLVAVESHVMIDNRDAADSTAVMRTLLATFRLLFLVLTVACVFLGISTAVASGAAGRIGQPGAGRCAGQLFPVVAMVGAIRFARSEQPAVKSLVPFMALNVVAANLTPVLLGVALWLG